MPVADVALAITGAGGLIVSVKVVVPVPPALLALSPTLLVPTVVGAPEIAPVDMLTTRPAGRLVALKLVGLFVATI